MDIGVPAPIDNRRSLSNGEHCRLGRGLENVSKEQRECDEQNVQMSNEKSGAREKSLENRGRRLGRPRDFCDLPIRRDEGRVVNTPLVFKRVLFEEKRKETEKEKKKSREREREEPALDGEKGLVRDWSGKTMNAGGVENRIWTDCTGLAYELNSFASLTNCLANKQCFYLYIGQ
ncbi:hypothetical protein TNCV_2384441 [Trichonephila clavipes]|nr:hypothetical protein TNCV_2384441 [Trichonephila clavipes]